jgi:hypothetical protein
MSSKRFEIEREYGIEIEREITRLRLREKEIVFGEELMLSFVFAVQSE